MSISKFQGMMKGGCGQVVIFGIAGVFVIGLVQQAACAGKGGSAQMSNGDMEIAQVGGVPIGANRLDQAVQASLAQAASGNPSPNDEIFAYASAMRAAVTEAQAQALAKQNGVTVDDVIVLRTIDAELAKQAAGAKDSLIQSGQLKAGATDAEVDAFIKSQTGGKTLAQVLKERGDELKALLKDPEKAAGIRSAVTQSLIVEAYAKRATISDADLLRGFDTLAVKRILARTTGVAEADQKAEAKIAQALAAAKSGTFEAAMDRFSEEPAPGPGKKISDNIADIPYNSVLADPSLAALRTLKAGETSPVVKSTEGYVVYRLVKVTNTPPKDFATAKEKYREQAKAEIGARNYQADLKAYGERNKPKFSSDAYAALYAYTQIDPVANPMAPPVAPADPAETTRKLREVVDLAKRVPKDRPDARIAAIVRTAAFDRLYTEAKDKAPLRAEYIETLLAAVETRDDFDARIKLVDEFLGERKYREAGEQLLAAAKTNANYDPQGQTRFGTVASKLLAIKKDSEVAPELQQAILDEQDRWRKENTAAEKDREAARKLQEEDAKRAAAAAPPGSQMGGPGMGGPGGPPPGGPGGPPPTAPPVRPKVQDVPRR